MSEACALTRRAQARLFIAHNSSLKKASTGNIRCLSALFLSSCSVHHKLQEPHQESGKQPVGQDDHQELHIDEQLCSCEQGKIQMRG